MTATPPTFPFLARHTCGNNTKVFYHCEKYMTYPMLTAVWHCGWNVPVGFYLPIGCSLCMRSWLLCSEDGRSWTCVFGLLITDVTVVPSSLKYYQGRMVCNGHWVDSTVLWYSTALPHSFLIGDSVGLLKQYIFNGESSHEWKWSLAQK